MQEKKPKRISPYADRMGRFIGQLRNHEGVTLEQLSRGLCTLSYLNKVENGEREIGKQLTDTFFQRLGKPVELFERILDHDEFVKWAKRQEIISHLRSGNTDLARSCTEEYKVLASGVLDQQFMQIIAINCLALAGAPAEELLSPVSSALKLTQPDFGTVPFDTLLLSQNEGRLLFAHMQLRQQLEGAAAVAGDYRAFMRYFKHKRYESRERVYLFPYVACRVIESDYAEGNYTSALAVCEDALAELTREKRLFAYDRLLDWKQKLFDATGRNDQTPGRLLEQLTLLQAWMPKRTELLIPCEEQGHVYSLNQVIRDRRHLLGFSQEEMSDDTCSLRSVSRIENEERKLHRKNRKQLLKKVNMSGERYDYEIISERYEDYLLRSELDRAITSRNTEDGMKLLELLWERMPRIPTNQQYLLKAEATLKESYPKEKLKDVLKLTLPLDLERISDYPASILTINEILTLVSYAFSCKGRKEYAESLDIFKYIKKCLEHSEADVVYYEDLYTRVGVNMASVLGNLALYQEALDLLVPCMRLSLESSNSIRLARYPYLMACCIKAQLDENPSEDVQEKRDRAIALLRQAYATAIISGDASGQKFILKYSLNEFGVDAGI